MTTQINNDMELAITFTRAKSDIQECWDNPFRENARITRDWLYAVEPSTMAFINVIWGELKGSYSLYTTAVKIMKSNSINDLIK